MSARWTTGPDVRPFARMSGEPVRLLEEMTSVDLALAVPHLRIYRVDPRSGRPAPSGPREMMFDLITPPTFDDPNGRFLERPLVSLLSARITSHIELAQAFREIELSFRVHRPDAIFSRDSRVPWRQMLVEGESFVLEYGWAADPRSVQNPLLNGRGFYDRSAGLVVPSQRSLLFNAHSYKVNILPDGQADVVIMAKENGERALREAQFREAAEEAWWRGLPPPDQARTQRQREAQWEGSLRSLLDGMPSVTIHSRGEFYRFGSILDGVLAPVIEKACRAFGYVGVDLFCGNFHQGAFRQSDAYGGEEMSGRSIADFLVPAKEFRRALARTLSVGLNIQVMSFISQVINFVNSAEAWVQSPDPERDKPNITLHGDDVEQDDGSRRFVLRLVDRQEAFHPFRKAERLPVHEQTRENVFRRVAQAGVPILELGRGNSFILGASFELQPSAQLQGVQIDVAHRARKDRVTLNRQPDAVTRRGQMLPREFMIPVSILNGEVQMIGNFVVQPLSPVWFEYYGADAISGLFTVTSKTDEIVPGAFRTNVEMFSEGLDPLNTRRRLRAGEA